MIELPDTSMEQGQREASVLIARMCGWLTTDVTFHNYFPPNGKGASVNHRRGHNDSEIFGLCPTLYNPVNMALAWRVLNWVASLDAPYTLRLMNIWSFEEWAKLPPSEAVRAWLDKILELANESGMLDGES